MLVVDDNYYNSAAVKIMLNQACNLNVAIAENGKAGYEAYVSNFHQKCCDIKFQMIIMDLQMPIMDGFQSAEYIYSYYEQQHKDPNFAHIKRPMVFAMTCFIETKKYSWVIKKCQEIGMNGILYKPVARKGLYIQVQKCLGKEMVEAMKKKAADMRRKRGKSPKKKKKDKGKGPK